MKFTRISFITGIVFMCLRLFGVTEWSWGYVCLPWAWFFGAGCREKEIEDATGADLGGVGV